MRQGKNERSNTVIAYILLLIVGVKMQLGWVFYTACIIGIASRGMDVLKKLEENDYTTWQYK